MNRQITKKIALLLAFILTAASVRPAFLTPVYGKPADTVSPDEAQTTVSEADAGEGALQDTASSEDSNDLQDIISEADVPDLSGNGAMPSENGFEPEVDEEGVTTGGGLKHPYYDGVNDEDGIELLGEPAEFEEAAGDENQAWNQPKYNAELTDGKLDINKMQNISPVRDQGYTGLCWMYGSIAAIESGLIKKYGISWNGIDLSVKHGAYYLFNKSKGSLGGHIDDDYIELRNDPVSDSDKWNNLISNGTWNGYIRRGAHAWMALQAFTSWKGVVDEDETNKLKFKDSGTIPMYNNEPRLEDSKTYDQKYQVRNADFYDYPWREKKRSELPVSLDKDKDLVRLKKAIVEHGALSGSMNTRFFDSTNTYAYHPGDPFPLEREQTRYANTTHLVTIVGWDDTIKKENFSNSKNKDSQSDYFKDWEFTPPGDGAWICKNSWNTNTGSNGFFYLSYYDGSLRNRFNCFAGYDTVIKGQLKDGEVFYDNNYQYNALATRGTLNMDGSSEAVVGSKPVYVYKGKHFGSVYKANSHETLEAVGITTRELDMTLNVKVYTSSANFLPPIENATKESLEAQGWTLSANSKGGDVRVGAGFHTIDLDKKIELSPGQNFLVIFTLVDRPDSTGAFIIRQENTGDDGRNKGVHRIYENRRYYFIGTEYEHKKASGYSFDDLDEDGGLKFKSNYDYDIRAFTTNGWNGDRPVEDDDKSYLVFSGEYQSLKLEQGSSVDMNKGLIFEPASHNGIWDSISANSWKSGDETVLKNLGNGKFEALSANETPVKVSVSTVFGVTAETSVTVKEKEKYYDISIELKKDSYDYTGGLLSVSKDVVIKDGDTDIYKWEGNKLITVSGFDISISENGAKNAGEAVLTVRVGLSANTVSGSSVGEDRLLKTEDIVFNIKPIDISNSATMSFNGVEDEYVLSGNEIKPQPVLIFNSPEPKVGAYTLVSYNGTEWNGYTDSGEEVYPFDYKQTYSGDLKTTGPKYVRLDGYGNFTGTKYLYWDVVDPKDPVDDTDVESGGFYVGKVTPRVVKYTGNRHVAGTSKKKSGFSTDLTLEVKYDGKLLSEGKDYSLTYKNNVNASTGVTEDKDKPCVLVKGLGKYKGLSATRYFGIDPAQLNDSNTGITGLKALYPVNDDASATVNPTVTFSFTDEAGKTVNRKLKKAVTKNNKTTGDYKLVFYKYIWPDDKDISGDNENYVGEWQKLKDNEVPVAKDYDYEYYLAVAEGVGNYAGASVEIETEDKYPYPYPWPGGQAQFIVCKKSITPGNGQLKGTSIKKVNIPDIYKKLTVSDPAVYILDLWEDPKTTVEFAYKNPDNKPGSMIISSNESDPVSHFISCYDKSKKEVEVITQPGSYTLRVVTLGRIPNGTMKGQQTDQMLAATKDISLKVTSGEKLKAENFTLEYSMDGKEFKNFEKNLKLDYDGNDAVFRIKNKKGEVITNGDDYYMTGAFTGNSFPGKYTLILQGQGIYGNSKLTWNFTRNKMPIDKALKSGGGKLEIAQTTKEGASVFGAMPRLKITDGYRGIADEEFDAGRQSTWFGLEFTGKNNAKPGQGELVIKAAADSPYSGKTSIPFEIVEYDIDAQQKGDYELTDISVNAIDNADRIFGVAEDVYDSGSKPVVKLYQYDATGMSRKEVPLNNAGLSITKDSKGADIVKITSDKNGLIKFPADGISIPIRVLSSSQKAKSIEIKKGTWVDKEFATKGAAFTGRSICPTITEITADGKTLSENQFIVDYEDNVKAGTAKVTIRAMGTPDNAVSGKKTFTFKIK